MKNLLLLFLLVFGLPSKGLPADQNAAVAPIERLVGQYGCMSCHGLVHKQVGPGFAQIADRYRGDEKAPALLAGRIRNGGVGNWGRVIMPRQARMSEAESMVLARWVLARPGP